MMDAIPPSPFLSFYRLTAYYEDDEKILAEKGNEM
jgi:hypothetical protein